MADKTTNGRGDTALPPMMTVPFGFEALMELNRPALQAMAQMNGKMYDGISTLNKNWVAFLNRRLKEDLAVPQQLADARPCRTCAVSTPAFSRMPAPTISPNSSK
jgi:hypothetical protein